MRAASPLFATLSKNRSMSPQSRAPCNHTTYWIRFAVDAIGPNTDHADVLKSKSWKRYIDYLRQLKQYNYILVADRPGIMERINVVIQYQTPTIIDMTKLPAETIVRESPLRLYKEKFVHDMITECDVIESGGVMDYELIDKRFVQTVVRSTSPIYRV